MKQRIRGRFGLSLLALSLKSLSTWAATGPLIPFHIDSEPASEGILEFAQQAGLTLDAIDPEKMRGLTTERVVGEFDIPDGLKKLLGHTGIVGVVHESTSKLVIKLPAPRVKSHTSRALANDGDAVPLDQNAAFLSVQPTVLVTGSRIGDESAADSSGQRRYDQEALDQSGAATLTDFLQLIPDNFNSVSAISSLFGNSVGTSSLGNNPFLGSGFNLAGLGPGATLTLLDGDRWVSGGASGTFPDLSVLPMNAITSIETLTGDTSAVYGPDAIAGVVNILTRSASEGSETRVRYGTTTSGGGGQWVLSQRLGGSWHDNKVMIAVQRAQQSPILSTARNYIPPITPAIDIVPRQSYWGFLGKLEHSFMEDTSCKLHVLYGARDVTADSSGFGGYLLKRYSPVEEYGGTVHIDQTFSAAWTVGLYGSFSTLRQSLTASVPGAPPQTQPGNSSLGELALSANAKPNILPGHDVKVAFGVGGRKESLTVPTTVYHETYTLLTRKVGDIYVEALFPLGSDSSTFFRRLDLSFVAREDYYESAGPTFNPKVGLVWSSDGDLRFRATFARSFRPPTLDQLAALPLYYTVNAPDHTSSTGFTDTLINQSQGILRLKPETAHTFTSGLDYRRDALQGWGGSATWFRTIFDNRVAAPVAGSVGPTSDIFTQPALASYISRPIDPAWVQMIFASPAFLQDSVGAHAAGVVAMFDNELTNIARTLEEGVNASLHYTGDGASHRWGAFVMANYLIRDSYRLAPGATTISLLNNVGQPPDLRARGGVSFSWGDWQAVANTNYTHGYPNRLVFPSQPVSAWTTLDFQLRYRLTVPAIPAKNAQLVFNARNILNAAPPWVYVPSGQAMRPVGFDAANASPFGRLVSLELCVAW